MWVIKKFKEEAWKDVEPLMGNISLEEHTRKQVQMHMAAQAILHRLEKKVKEIEEVFGIMFSYDQVYFAMLNDSPVTVERSLPGKFVKYVNNNGIPGDPDPMNKELYQKAEAVCHFSFKDNVGKLLLLDLQGVGYKLCDPEIATVMRMTKSCSVLLI